MNVTVVITRPQKKAILELILEGVKYECDKCDYKATAMGSLRRHQEIKHGGMRYECDRCDYKATKKNYVRTY